MKLIDILREIKDPDLGDVVFADEDDVPYFARMQSREPGSEPDTEKEREIYQGIVNWVKGHKSKDSAVATFNDNEALLRRAREKFPQVLKPSKPNGTPVYRGLLSMNKDVMDQLSKSTKPEDWGSRVKTNFDVMFMCSKPVTYRPRSEFQSWTYSFNVAAETFGADGVLVTQQDDDFYFNSEALAIFYSNYSYSNEGFEDEQETVHFGKEYANPVYVYLTNNKLKKMFPEAAKAGAFS